METVLKLAALAGICVVMLAAVAHCVIAAALGWLALQVDRIARACEEDAGLGEDEPDAAPEPPAVEKPRRRSLRMAIQRHE